MNLSNENTSIFQDVLGEGTLKAGRIQKSHQDGRPGPPLHSWKYPILVKTRAILPSCHLSFLCCKCELKIRAQKNISVSFESAVKRQDLTFGILRYHLICDICPQLKDFFSLINRSLGFFCPLWDWLEPRHWQEGDQGELQSLQTPLQLICVSCSRGVLPLLWPFGF